jgi:RNA recognition motif-containing protein
MNDERSIFVSNLAWNTSELTLGRHFEKCGDIEMVKILEDNFGRSRGFGFVEFEKKGILNMVETVQAAILLNE